MVRRRFVALVLLYIALDLSLPWVPGAFVFDAAESVESVQRNRLQDASTALSGPAIAPGRRGAPVVADTTTLTPSAETRRLVPMPRHPRPPRSITAPDFPPPSEDPH